ncbi:RTM1-like protein [Fusarium heterosporum]|uniref:RTM1-like protein n=1 Tax=Fusarium heterosporum TaxID=42747 RepID=A0A8H5T2R9_FUSHE|nr:RTM1-like protein [Fusarium heterosporum]
MAALELYHYDPSFIPAIVALGLFSASTAVCLLQILRCRTWFFIPFLLGCAVEALGYAGRAISARESPHWSTVPYATQTFATLLGPTLMAATLYIIVRKLIMALDADSHALIPARVLPKVFIFGDLISMGAQLTGASMFITASSVDKKRTGQLIIVGGLAFQIYFFGFFTSILHIIHSRMLDKPTRQSASLTIPWKRWVLVIYVACGLMIARSVYRIIEYGTGPTGIVQTTEIYFYVFDACFIFIATALLNIFHPGSLATVSVEDLPDVETVIVTPSKPAPRHQPPHTSPRYAQPPPYLPTHGSLRNRGPHFNYPPSTYRTQTAYKFVLSPADSQDQQELQSICKLFV